VLCVVIPFVFCLVTRRPPAPPLFPYTTLFRSKRLGLGFNDAVRQVAERVGVEIPEPGRRSGDERHRPLYEAVAFAADFFRRQLWDEPVGEVARRYLERRGIPREAAERFLLGYAPDEWTALRDAARSEEHTSELQSREK